MEIEVAVRLIEGGVEKTGSVQVWADFGAGKGLFTKALATLLSNGSTIYAIDKDGPNEMKPPSEKVIVKTLKKDFIKDKIELVALDGIIMANSLHYVQEQLIFLKTLKEKLKPNGRLLLVEYDTTISNQWIPYPVSYKTLQTLAPGAGFKLIDKLDQEPSLYQQANIYAALVQ